MVKSITKIYLKEAKTKNAQTWLKMAIIRSISPISEVKNKTEIKILSFMLVFFTLIESQLEEKQPNIIDKTLIAFENL